MLVKSPFTGENVFVKTIDYRMWKKEIELGNYLHSIDAEPEELWEEAWDRQMKINRTGFKTIRLSELR